MPNVDLNLTLVDVNLLTSAPFQIKINVVDWQVLFPFTVVTILIKLHGLVIIGWCFPFN